MRLRVTKYQADTRRSSNEMSDRRISNCLEDGRKTTMKSNVQTVSDACEVPEVRDERSIETASVADSDNDEATSSV